MQPRDNNLIGNRVGGTELRTAGAGGQPREAGSDQAIWAEIGGRENADLRGESKEASVAGVQCTGRVTGSRSKVGMGAAELCIYSQ